MVLPELVFLNIETVVSSEFATARSGLLSPSRSPTVTPTGVLPTARSVFGENEITPPALVFLSTEIELAPLFVIARSGLLSPLKSTEATLSGVVPVAKSVFAVNEIVPPVLVFLKTETVLVSLFVTIISGLPSPSRSSMQTCTFCQVF